MARVFTDGAEMGDMSFWDVPGGGSAVIATPTPYESEWCYKLTGYGGTNSLKVISAVSEGYFRLRFLTHNNGPEYILGLMSTTGGNIIRLRMNNATNQWEAVVGASTVVASSVIAGLVDTWYLLQIYVKIDNAPNGRFVLYVDGNKLIDFTGDTQAAATTTFNYISCGHGGTGSWMALDDMAYNDTTGGVDISYPQDGVIEKIIPIGDGAHNNWHGSDGDDIDNWDLVSEYPKDDDTTYVYHDSSATGTQDQYEMSDTWDDTNKIVTRVYAEARCRKTSADSSKIKLGILPSGGVDQMSPALDVYVNYYNRVVGSEYLVNPVDSSAWEKADIDALEGIVEVA